MANPAPTINQINAFNATQGTTIDFNIIGGTELVRSNRIYIYDLSDNSLICTHLYVSTESIHELPSNTDSSIVYESGKSSADFVNNTQYYAQIQTFTDTNGTQGASGLSVAKLFWCLPTPTLTLTTIPTTISTTSYNVSATYTPNTSGGATNEIQEFQFNLYSGVGALLQTSGVVLYGEGVDLSYNFSGLEVDSTYYVTLDVTTTQGMNVSAQSNTFTISIDTPTMGSASVVNNGCDGYISVTSNLSSEYEHEQSVDAGEIMSFTTDSANNITELDVDFSPVQDGTPWQSTTEEQEPYFLRAIPNVGHSVNREYDTLVGGSVAWNQLVQNGNFADTSKWTKADSSHTTFSANNNVGTVTITDNTSSGRPNILQSQSIIPTPIIGHKYLITLDYKITSSTASLSNRYLSVLYGDECRLQYPVVANTWSHFEKVANVTTTTYKDFSIYNSALCSNFANGDTFEHKNVQCIDLTQMFGSTIADYIYTLEQNNSGAGVAWFKKLFPKPYYAYNAGELMSVNASAHNTIGFNQWDEETESGYINSDGTFGINANALRSKNFCPCVPNTTYYFKKPSTYTTTPNICWYDANKTFISRSESTPFPLIPSPSDARYFKISMWNYGATYNNDICINLSWDGERDGEYEEYVKHSYPLDSSLTLRGIPKLDANNSLYYDGDTYESDGTVTRKYGIVDLGTLDWTYQSQYTRFYTSDISSVIKKPSTNNEQINALCLKYTQSSSNGTASQYSNNTFGVGTGGSVLIRDESYSDETTFTSAMSGVYLIYELATPTTETADTFTNPQVCNPYGTEEYTTNTIVPVGHNTTYMDVYPISGWSSVNATICGKNLFDKSAVSVGKILDTTTGLEISSGGYDVTDYIPVEANKTVYIPASGTIRRWFYDKNKNPKTFLNNSGNQAFTPTEDGFIRVSIHVLNDIDIDTYQIELGSTATAYEAYNGTTYTSVFPKYKQQVSQDTIPYITKDISDTYADTLTESLVGGTIAWNQSVPDTTTTHTVSGSIASFPDGVVGNLTSLVADIDPIQDLHGYDAPWVGGAGKNLFDKDNANVAYGYITSSAFSDSNNKARTIYIPIKPNTTYTVSKAVTARFAIATSSVIPANEASYTSRQTGNTATSLTITSGASDAYLWAWVYLYDTDDVTYESVLASLQIEEGSTATSYAPYSNICPISGWNSVGVVDCGVNIFDGVLESGTINSTTGVEESSSSVKRSTHYFVVGSQVTYFSYASGTVGVRCYDKNKAYIGNVPASTNSTFTTLANTRFVRFVMSNGVASNPVSINYPSTDTTYHAYNGTTYTVSWSGDAGTVYGGTLDVVSGELTVDRRYVVLDGVNNKVTGAYGSNAQRLIGFNISSDPATGATLESLICDSLTPSANILTDEYAIALGDGNSKIIPHIAGMQGIGGTYADNTALANAINTWLSNNNVTCVYELATPTTYTLTAQQVACLLGTNNVFCDSGNVSVTYPTNHSYQSLFATHKYYKRLNGVESISVGSDVVVDVGTDNIIDLTQMFGTTIADYIYNREQSSSSGMGVKFFKSLFPNNDYDYNGGELISVKASAHVIKDANGNVVHTYPLDSDLVLRGIPKLDASNKLYYDGDTYASDGTVTRKYGIVDLGTLSWAYQSTYDFFYVTFSHQSATYLTPSYMCSKYTYGGYNTSNSSMATAEDKTIIKRFGNGLNSNANAIYVKDSDYTDATTFKSAMNGVYLVYELDTPTIESADPFEENQTIIPNGIEEYVVPEQGDVEMPVGHNSTYYTTEIYGGTIDMASGVLTTKYAIVDLGDLSWTYSSGGNERFQSTDISSLVVIPPTDATLSSCICSNYPTKTANQVYGGDTAIAINKDGNIWVHDSAYGSDYNAFKTAMDGVQLVYELATPITMQLTPQQMQTLSGQNNIWSNTNGGMFLVHQLPITSLLVKRRDVADVSGKWLTLYSVPITQASDMDFTFIDFLNQYGKKYQYALVPALAQNQSGVVVQIEGGYTVSDNVDSIFDGVYIADQTNVERVKAGVGYGNIDMNQGVGSITPIGSKYPIVITNSQNQYHNGSIRGTIVPNDFYSNGNLSRIDMVNKRDELEQFLTNKRAKIIKDWNGKMWLVMIMSNVNCSFDDNYGMGMVSFNADWLEVGDPTNQQDLYNAGLINVGGV